MKKDNITLLLEELYSLKWQREVELREILHHFYVKQDMSMDEVAKTLHMSKGYVHKRIKEFAITKDLECKK